MKKMKRIFLLCLTCFLLIGATGCGIYGLDTIYTTKESRPSFGGRSETGSLKEVFSKNSGKDSEDSEKGDPVGGADYIASLQNKTYPLHQTAVLLYKIVFGGEGKIGSSESSGCVPHKDISINVEPASLVVKINNKTMEEMESNTSLNALTTGIQGLAFAILFVIWMMGFISQIVNERFSVDVLIRTLLQLACGALIVANAKLIVEAFSAVSKSIAMSGKINMFDGTLSAFRDEITDSLTNGVWRIEFGGKIINVCFGVGGWFDMGSVAALAYLIFPSAACLMCVWQLASALIMRMLELLARITFAPIPLALSAQRGFSQEVIRYLRATLACALQPIFMIAGCLAFGAIQSVTALIFGESPTGIFGSIACGFSFLILSTYLGQTKRLSQEIIAH